MTYLKQLFKTKTARILATVFLLSIYLAYVVFVIQADRGPIDYETFMRIGAQLMRGEEVYGENSYYPLPYVAIFGIFSLFPRYLSMTLWLLAPVIIALVITRFKPHTLLFAPIFSHFAGGQSSVFGLLGFFGYRMNVDPSKYAGGFWLALTLLKPQLGIVPVGYAVYQWAQFVREKKRIPKQLLSFVSVVALMYLPAFLYRPGWLMEWLSVPRPMLDRAVSSAIPRLLFFVSSPGSVKYWLLWIVVSALVILIVWRLRGRSHDLDILVLISFVVNPLVHDYDLIQVLPTIWGPIMPAASIVLSLPGWWTITTGYATDAAWITFILIAPGLLAAYIYQCRRGLERNTGSTTSPCSRPAGGGRDSDRL